MKTIRKLKNRKINSKKMIGLASLILIGGMVTSCDSIFLNKEYEYTRIEFNSYGEYKETKQFKPFDSNNNKDLSNSFTYYSAWELRDDGRYQRDVKEYDIKSKNYSDVSNIIRNEDELNEFLKKPNKTYVEITNNITKEENERGSYYDITIYDLNKDRYAYIEEGDKNYLLLIGCGVLIPIAVGSLIAWNKYNETIDDKKDKKLTLKK